MLITRATLTVLLLIVALLASCNSSSPGGTVAVVDGISVGVPAGGSLTYKGGPGWSAASDMLFVRWDKPAGAVTGFRMVVDDAGYKPDVVEGMALSGAQYNVDSKGWKSAAELSEVTAAGRSWQGAKSDGNPQPLVPGADSLAVYVRLADAAGKPRLLWCYFDYAPANEQAALSEAANILASVKVKGEK